MLLIVYALVDDTTCGTHEVLFDDDGDDDALLLLVLATEDIVFATAACSREVMVNGEVQAVVFDSVAATLPDAG